MNPLDFFLHWFPGWKAAIAGVGQIGLGLYQLSEGNLEAGVALLVSGFGLLFESMRS